MYPENKCSDPKNRDLKTSLTGSRSTESKSLTDSNIGSAHDA